MEPRCWSLRFHRGRMDVVDMAVKVHPRAGEKGNGMFSHKLITVQLAVVGSLLTGAPALAEEPVHPAPVVATSPSGGSNPIGSECQGMTKSEATVTFRHKDGTRSSMSEWARNGNVLTHEGPVVMGVSGENYFVYGRSRGNPGRTYTLEGVAYKGRNFQVWCLTDVVTNHTDVPPEACPQTVDEAVDWRGGNPEDWGVVEWSPYSGIRNVAAYSGKEELGSFTVSLQSLVEITLPEVDGVVEFQLYGPGDLVPPTNVVFITCYR